MPVTRSSRGPHRDRRTAESFGADADRYDRARPSYPEAMVRRIIDASPGAAFLDVGCGTGIAARLFQAAGCQVLGIDVDQRMADRAHEHGLDVEVAAFEAWNAGGRTFDGAVAGQAWHWVDPIAGAAKAAEVLRPGGRLAVFWNAGQPPPDLTESFAGVYRRLAPESLAGRGWTRPTLDGYLMLAERAADGIRQTGGFGDPNQWRFDWERPYARDEWLDQLPTQADHGQFPKATLAAVMAGIGEAIDAAGGTFIMSYATVVTTAERIGVRQD